MLFNYQDGTFTAVSGAASTTLTIHNALLRQIIVKATTGTTTFDVTLTDHLGNVLITAANNTGTYNALVQAPILRNATLAIASASVDEAFDFYVAAEE